MGNLNLYDCNHIQLMHWYSILDLKKFEKNAKICKKYTNVVLTVFKSGWISKIQIPNVFRLLVKPTTDVRVDGYLSTNTYVQYKIHGNLKEIGFKSPTVLWYNTVKKFWKPLIAWLILYLLLST